MTQWRKDLREASFRGVKFFVANHDFETGRRGVQHEFVQRDEPFTEDTGRRGRKFTVEGYVLGKNYMPIRDALISACEKEGSGELIHPYLGKKVVQCFECKVRESNREGGIAIFTISFAEAGKEIFPDSGVDPKKAVATSSQSLISKAKDAFAKVFSVDGQPGFVGDSAISTIGSFSDHVTSLSSEFSSTTSEIADLAFSIRKTTANALDLIQTPKKLADQLASNIAFLKSAAGKINEAFAALGKLFQFGSDMKPIERTTTTREVEAENRDAITELVGAVAIGEAAVAASEMEFPSLAEAVAARTQIADAIEAHMETVTDDEVFIAYQDMLAKVVQSVPPADQNIGTIGQLQNNVSMPAIVIAYNLYGSIDLEADLISRNKVSHPGFVPGGIPLEVLQLE